MQAPKITGTVHVNNPSPKVTGSMKVNGAGAGGTTDYEKLRNKPSIEHVELVGNKDFSDLGLEKLDNMEILTMFNEVFHR